MAIPVWYEENMNFTKELEQIRDADRYAVFLATTGGGAGAQKILWEVPGASKYLAGSAFTYAAHETDRLLGFKPTNYCSMDSAIEMAMACYHRASEAIVAAGEWKKREPVGVAVTAAVATTRELRGGYRAHVAVMTRELCWAQTKNLEPGTRERHGRDCDDLAIEALLEGMRPNSSSGFRNQPMSHLESIFFQHPVFEEGVRKKSLSRDLRRTVFLPGSFNPLHSGHIEMARTIETVSNKDVVFTVTADPPHKPPLSVQEMIERASQFTVLERMEVIFTHGDGLFVEKAEAFKGVSFVIGADTALRLLSPEWYPLKEVGVGGMLQVFQDLGTKFYVFGRLVPELGFVDPATNPLLSQHPEIFVPIPGRWDVCSTELRKKHGAEA